MYRYRMARAYQLKARATRQDATRQRIVDAAIALHQTVGPSATTVTDVAERAGVGRVTVYRHFPTELDLAQACSGHYFATHPAPDLREWAEIADPVERLRTGLRAAFAYHDANQAMMSRVLADARDHEVMRPYHAYWASAADVLLAPWRARGTRRAELRATIALALSFDTWRTLVGEHGIAAERGVELLIGMIDREDAARRRRP